MKIEMIVTGPVQENCYIVMDVATSEAIIVDPGNDAPRSHCLVVDLPAGRLRPLVAPTTATPRPSKPPVPEAFRV